MPQDRQNLSWAVPKRCRLPFCQAGAFGYGEHQHGAQ